MYGYNNYRPNYRNNNGGQRRYWLNDFGQAPRQQRGGGYRGGYPPRGGYRQRYNQYPRGGYNNTNYNGYNTNRDNRTYGQNRQQFRDNRRGNTYQQQRNINWANRTPLHYLWYDLKRILTPDEKARIETQCRNNLCWEISAKIRDALYEIQARFLRLMQEEEFIKQFNSCIMSIPFDPIPMEEQIQNEQQQETPRINENQDQVNEKEMKETEKQDSPSEKQKEENKSKKGEGNNENQNKTEVQQQTQQQNAPNFQFQFNNVQDIQSQFNEIDNFNSQSQCRFPYGPQEINYTNQEQPPNNANKIFNQIDTLVRNRSRGCIGRMSEDPTPKGNQNQPNITSQTTNFPIGKMVKPGHANAMRVTNNGQKIQPTPMRQNPVAMRNINVRRGNNAQ